MESFYQQYAVLVAVLIGGLGLVAIAFGAARVIAPRRQLPEKLTTYECGIDPVGEGWAQTQIRYYIFALLFVMFDVEAVFIFPWAVQLERLAVFGLVEMVVFIVILALGLVYAWRKDVLRWL